jgi:hypothetical protein
LRYKFEVRCPAGRDLQEIARMMTLYSGTTDPFSQRCRIVLH